MEPRPLTAIPAEFTPVIALDECFDAVYGLEVLDEGTDDGAVRGRVEIRDELRQQFGLLHGGVISALAEALACFRQLPDIVRRFLPQRDRFLQGGGCCGSLALFQFHVTQGLERLSQVRFALRSEFTKTVNRRLQLRLRCFVITRRRGPLCERQL